MAVEVEKTTLSQLTTRYLVVTGSMSESSYTTGQSIIKKFLAWWPHGRDYQVRSIRPSMLDEWLAHEEPRLRNVTYNCYAGFLKQLFDIAVKDRIIPDSPAKLLFPTTKSTCTDSWQSWAAACRRSRPSDSGADGAPSEAMKKGLKKSHAPADPHPASAPLLFLLR